MKKYSDLYSDAIKRLRLRAEDVNDYRPAIKLYMPEIKDGIPNAIIIWLKTGEKIIFIDKIEE